MRAHNGVVALYGLLCPHSPSHLVRAKDRAKTRAKDRTGASGGAALPGFEYFRTQINTIRYV